MYTRKKPFWQRKWFYFVLVGIFVFGYWVNGDIKDMAQRPEGGAEDGQAVIEITPVDESPLLTNQERFLPDEVIRAQAELKAKEEQEQAKDASVSEQAKEPDPGAEDPQTQLKYYLIKEVNGEIQVYCVNRDGTESLFWNTEIPFSLLSETDQKLFSKGLEISSQADLEELLQDFSS